MKHRLNHRFLPAIIAITCAGSAHAAVVTKAATGSDLGLAAAWGAALPTSSDVATWSGTSLGGALTNSTVQIWGAIDIQGATDNLSISGSDVSLSGTGVNIAAAGKDLAIANKIILGSGQTWTVGTGRSMIAGGIVSGANALTKAGAGKLTLSGANSYSGGTTLSAGTVYVGSNSALGTGTITANAAATLASDGSTARTLANAFSLTTGNALTFGDTTGTGPLTFSGTTTLSTAGGARAMSVASGVTATFTGVVAGGSSGTSTFTKSGTGKLSLLNTASTVKIITSPGVVATGGTLEVTKLANTGSNSSIGYTTIATTSASIGLDGSTLNLIDPASPSPSTTDRLLKIGQTAAGGTGTIQNNNASAANTLTFSNANAIAYGTTAQTRTLNLGGTNTGANTIASIIGNNGTGVVTVNKNDAGQWALSGVNTYNGATTISAGTLTGITGGSCASSAVALTPTTGNTASLRVSCPAAGNQWTCSSLTCNSGGTGTGLQFVLGASPSTTIAPLSISGTATFNVTPAVGVDPTGLVSGNSYPLLVVAGTPPSSNVPTTATIGRGLSGTLAWGTGSPFSTNTLVLTVSGTSSDPLTWNSSATGTWDVNNSGNAVWKDMTTATTYYQEQFSSGNAVQFADTGLSADTTVTLAGAVTPGSMTVNNTTYNYTFSGSGGITGTTGLTKTGTGTLTLATTNSYTGAVAINGGTLTAGSSTALGTTAAGTTINSGGVLDTNAQTLGTEPITLAGGKIVNNGAIQSSTFVSGALTVTANSKIGGLNRWDIRGTGALVTIYSGVTLTKEDANLIYLNVSSGTSIVNNGLIQIDGGDLGIYSNAITGTGSFLVNSGANLRLESSTNNPQTVTLNGGTLYCLTTAATQSGPVTLQADSALNIAAATTISGAIGETGGAHLLTKTGTSTVTLSGANSYSGGTTLSQGTITVGTGGTLGATTGALSVNNTNNSAAGNAVVLNLATAVDTTVGSLSGTLATPTSGTNTATINTQTGRNFTVNQTLDNTYAGVIAGAGGFTLGDLSTSKLTLSGTNTYTGATTVNGGTLVMNSRNAPTMDVTVADSAALTVVPTGAPLIPLTINNLNLGTAGTPILNLPGNYISPPAAAIYCQNLTANGTTTLNITGTFSVGTYPLIHYVTKTGTGTFTVGPLPRGVVGHIADSGTTIDLVVTGFDSLTWKGAPGAAWDINTSANWKLGASLSEKFLNGDNVCFDATATSTNVTLDEFVVPNTVSFDFNAPAAYTLSGSGSIDGSAPLLKTGSGVLTISTANTFTGPVTINGGTLLMDSIDALGTTAGGVTVASGGTLDINGFGVGAKSLTLSGGSLDNSFATTASWAGAVQLASGTSQIVATNPITLSGAISGTGNLRKTGSATVTISGAKTFSGSTTVIGGVLAISSLANGGTNSSIGTSDSTAANLVLDGSTLRYNGAAASCDRLFTIGINGATLESSGSGALNLTNAGAITLAGTDTARTFTLGGTGSGNNYYNAALADNGAGATSLVKTGTVLWGLPNTNTYTGPTTVNAGTLVIGLDTLATSASVTLNGTSTLRLGITGTTTIRNLSGASGTTLSNQFTFPTSVSGPRDLVVNQSVDGVFAGSFYDGGFSRPISLTKQGSASLTLGGDSSAIQGPTTINGGTLAITGTLGTTTAVTVNSPATLDCGSNISGNAALGASMHVTSGGHLAFHIAADHTAQITRTLTGALTLDTGNILDLTAVTAPAGGVYILVKATGGISGTPTTVNLPSGVTGTVAVNGNNLELTVGSGDYSAWAALFSGFTDTDPTHDPDHDGLTNLQEYAFGLDPTKGSSVSPVTAPDKTAGTFTYTRRKQSLTGLTYTYESSTTLGGWAGFTPVSATSNSGDPVETITVTLTPALLAEPKLFLRVVASQP